MIEISTASESQCWEVMSDPWVWDRITDDHCPPAAEFQIPNSPVYLAGHVNNELAALYTLADFWDGMKMHFMVRRSCRRDARALIRAFLDISPRPLYIIIPSLYPGVVNFAEKVGFSMFHVEHDSYLKNRKLYNENWMGLWDS